MLNIDKKDIKAPRGEKLNCKGWQQESILRMFLNNLDREVAEDPDNLIVYGGIGKACRDFKAFDNIVKTLQELENDETMLIQSGKPVTVLKTTPLAPRAILANSLIVPHWANWEKFRELEKKGLIMYGQMTAGSWIYIGTQGILQGTFETFMAAAKKHFNSDLKGRLVVSGGLGGMSGAQPLACTMANGVYIGVEMDKTRIQKRLDTKYLDILASSFEEAIELALKFQKNNENKSIGVVGNIVDFLQILIDKNIVPDLLTDQTSAHDELNGYFPTNLTFEDALKLRKDDPFKYCLLSKQTMVEHVKKMIKLQEMGSITFDYGNNLRGQALAMGLENAFSFPGFVPAYIRDLFCEGKGPFRWVALSGDPEDIYKTDEAVLKTFPNDENLKNWIPMAKERVSFQGLPARICWLGQGEREKFGKVLNDMVKNGELKGPIVVGRDHLDTGSVASPNRETESMKDGSDVIADWPVLNLLTNAISGATWVSLHHGGGVGMGYSIHAGMVITLDGTKEAEEKLKRVFHNDPATGVIRHLDAGYELAKETAKKNNIKFYE